MNIRNALLVFASLSLAACSSNPSESTLESQATAFVEFNESVMEFIPDSTRANEIMVLIEELEDKFTQTYDLWYLSREELAALSADYDAPREDFINLERTQELVKIDSRTEIFAIHSELNMLLTEEEWKELGKSREQAMNAGFAAIKSVTLRGE